MRNGREGPRRSFDRPQVVLNQTASPEELAAWRARVRDENNREAHRQQARQIIAAPNLGKAAASPVIPKPEV